MARAAVTRVFLLAQAGEPLPDFVDLRLQLAQPLKALRMLVLCRVLHDEAGILQFNSVVRKHSLVLIHFLFEALVQVERGCLAHLARSSQGLRRAKLLLGKGLAQLAFYLLRLRFDLGLQVVNVEVDRLLDAHRDEVADTVRIRCGRGCRLLI